MENIRSIIDITTNYTGDIVIITHSNCQDGLISAYLLQAYCEENNIQTTIIYSYHDGNTIDLSKLTNKNIIMVDIVTTNVSDIMNVCDKIIILDHHVSNYEQFKDFTNYYFDKNKCGATLVYEYLYGNRVPIPYFIQCIQARDIWSWDVNYAKEFTTGFFEKCKYSDNSYLLFQQLLNDTPELTFFHEIVEYGANLILIENQFILSAFNQHKDQIVHIRMKNDDTNSIYKILLIQCDNKLYSKRSDIGNYCMQHLNIDFCVLWRFNTDYNEYHCAIRSIEGRVNLNEKNISKGHDYAGGITLHEHPQLHFIRIDKNEMNERK